MMSRRRACNRSGGIRTDIGECSVFAELILGTIIDNYVALLPPARVAMGVIIVVNGIIPCCMSRPPIPARTTPTPYPAPGLAIKLPVHKVGGSANSALMETAMVMVIAGVRTTRACALLDSGASVSLSPADW